MSVVSNFLGAAVMGAGVVFGVVAAVVAIEHGCLLWRERMERRSK